MALGMSQPLGVDKGQVDTQASSRPQQSWGIAILTQELRVLPDSPKPRLPQGLGSALV